MIPERDRKFNPFPLLAAVAGLGAGALFFFTRSVPPLPPEPEPTEETSPPSPSAEPEASPKAAPAVEPQPEPEPAEAEPDSSIEASSGPPAPHEEKRPSEDDLFGPLPSRDEPEEIAAIPTLHKEIPFNVPPPPRAAAVDVPQIAAQRERWPARVLLRKAIRFPVVINGQNAGSVLVPERAAVNVKNVFPDGRLEIGYHNASAIVPASATDFLLRAKAQAQTTPPPARHRPIVTFPDTTFNPALSSPSSPSAGGNREIPIR